MKISPTLKQKKRYVRFEIMGEEQLNASEVERTVFSALLQFVGELGMSRMQPMFVKEKFSFPYFVLKVAHTYVDECRAGIILIKKIKNKPVIIKSIITSGTLKKLA